MVKKIGSQCAEKNGESLSLKNVWRGENTPNTIFLAHFYTIVGDIDG